MISRAGTALCALALIAGCKAQEQSNEAAASNNVVRPETGTEVAAPVTPAQAKQLFDERHEGMEKIGKATKAASQQLKSGSPDLAVIRSSAATIADLAAKSANWFPAGTGKDVNPKTRAKPEIWQKPEDFAAKDRDFNQAAKAFKAAADGGDLTGIKAAFDSLGKACKACHDSYRAPEHD